MQTMRRRAALLLLLGFMAISLSASDDAWRAAVARASKEEKPIVVFSRPLACREKRIDVCKQFEKLASHPAVQRRLLQSVYIETTAAEGVRPTLSVHAPSGELSARWALSSDPAIVSRMLRLIDTARPHLIEWLHASRRADLSAKHRAAALAALALGDEAQGRELLSSLLRSAVVEDRELASVWMERLKSLQSKSLSGEEIFARLSQTGATGKVKFEASVALASLLFETGRAAESEEVFKRAVLYAPTPSDADSVLTARQRALEATAPIVGLGLPGSLVVGRRTIQPRTVSPEIVKIDYVLDGKRVATAKRPPFATSIRFARIPTRQTLGVIAFDREGNEKQRWSVTINEPGDTFAVEIVEPASLQVSGEVPVSVNARFPRGRKVDKVTIEWGGEAVAAMSSPPYATRINVKEGAFGILRAAARLDDGTEIEDVKLLNAGAMNLESEVNLIEIPLYLEGAKPEKLAVREDGVRRTIERVVPASEVPLRIALLLDASGSMATHLFDIQEAALRFTERNLDARDRVMVVSFDNSVRLWWPTTDRKLIERAVLNLGAGGGTALNDAMVSSLLQLQSTGSRRALVVFSDGVDNNSRFTSAEAAEVARRSGVPVYVLSVDAKIGPISRRFGRGVVLTPSENDIVVRARRALYSISKTTGGKAFRLKELSDLESIWAAVGEDLQRQSLLVYRTDSRGRDVRDLEISLDGKKLRSPEHVYVESDAGDSEAIR